MTKTLIAFDLDGTIFKGPPSFLTLLKFKFSHSKLYSNHPDNIEPEPISLLAHKLDDLDDYGIFASFFVQKPQSKIIKIIQKLHQPQNSLVILSGRGRKLLQNITLNQLKKHDLLKYFAQVYLKPKNYKSSTTWKFHALKEFTQQYSQVYLFENDLITSLKIGHFAQTHQLPITIILIPSLETHPLILKFLKLDKKTLLDNNIQLFTSNLKLF